MMTGIHLGVLIKCKDVHSPELFLWLPIHVLDNNDSHFLSPIWLTSTLKAWNRLGELRCGCML